YIMTGGNIFYMAVGRVGDRVLIASQCAQQRHNEAKFQSFVGKAFRGIKVEKQQKCTITSNTLNAHYVISEDCIFMVLCDKKYPRRVAYQALQHFAETFIHKYKAKRIDGASELSLSSKSADVFRAVLARFDDPAQSGDRISAINSDLDDLRVNMTSNIDSVLSNQAGLRELQTSADELASQANSFQRESRGVKNQTCIRRCRMYFILVALIALILLVIYFNLKG
ncbi:hypothetical protein KIPB_011438, partial [Kipferlia bialata]